MSTSINSIRDLAVTARGRRLSLGLSQAELAARAHVSRQWISEFEAGKPAAELRLVIQLLDALGLHLTLSERDRVRRDRPGSARTVDLDELLEDYREQ
jgi:transcriptional regulator with XRE-family HTH domain